MSADRPATAPVAAPVLPPARGPVSAHVLALLLGGAEAAPLDDAVLRRCEVDDDDLHLGLYLLYELHYRGCAAVAPELEWSPAVLALRARLEGRFLELLQPLVDVPEATPTTCAARLRELLDGFEGPSLSAWVEKRAELPHLRDLAVHRSAYQLKEADPHTFVIPRLWPGVAKSALLALQFDEYGNGEPGASHAELFAATMASLGLDATYGRYLEVIPGTTLATVNLLSLFGLHRRWRGACIGHLAVFEMTSVVPMQRYARAHRRVTGAEAGAEFYDVHVVADGEHQVIAADELVPHLVLQEPEVVGDVLFGAAALLALEDRYARRVLQAWEAGRTSLLREPLAATAAVAA
jgi:hypothetical protein